MSNIEAITAKIITARLYDKKGPDKELLASLRSAPTLDNPKAQKVVPLLMKYLDSSQLSRTGVPTKAEQAVYTALRLYALHQQGNETLVYASSAPQADGADDAEQGLTLFRALAQLKLNQQTRSNIDRRVQQTLALSRIDALTNALTHLVSSLHRSGLKVDYARLAQDLYQFQWGYEAANHIRLRWAQDYYYQSAQNQANEGVENHDN